jgi:L-aspartate oxidase
MELGINIAKYFIPVVPAAHYSCGGILTNLNGRTTLKNLYSLGESAMTGVHGANRLASNSLLEALVFADKAGIDCEKYFFEKINRKIKEADFIPDWDESGTDNSEEWVIISQNKNEIKQTMSNYVGIVRSNLRLNMALRRISMIKKEIENFYKKTKVNRELIELRNIALIAELIIKSAIWRKESRGLHYNTDYPYTSNKYLKDTIISQRP